MASGDLNIGSALESLARGRPGLWSVSACGVTRSQSPIPALVDQDAYTPAAERPRVLLVSGLEGQRQDVELTLRALEEWAGEGDGVAARVALSAVPCANPDGLARGVGPENGVGGLPASGYPPEGDFFNHSQDPEKRYLWRWICFQAPDLVVELQSGPRTLWEVNDAAIHLAPLLDAKSLGPSDSLMAALGRETPDGVGSIYGVRLTVEPGRAVAELDKLWTLVLSSSAPRPSPARVTLERRQARSPMQIGRILASVYGRTLDPVVYTQGVAISGRLRLAALDPSASNPAQDIVSVVSRYAANPHSALGDMPQAAGLAGLVWGDELADAAGDSRFADLVVTAADCYQPRGQGQAPSPADPDFRVEDMFCAATILGRAYRITGNRSYVDLLAELLISAGTQREDGLFWHCLSAPYYWGRGNGFAALGMAEALTYLPADHPHRDAIVSMLVKQMDALRVLQEPSGMHRQVLDSPGSYQEFTATCMIGYAMARGLRLGWLDPSYQVNLSLAWRGVTERIDDHGRVVDACTGTGVQASLQDYLDRPAISGVDDRSGSMALWFAVEMERLARVVDSTGGEDPTPRDTGRP